MKRHVLTSPPINISNILRSHPNKMYSNTNTIATCPERCFNDIVTILPCYGTGLSKLEKRETTKVDTPKATNLYICLDTMESNYIHMPVDIEVVIRMRRLEVETRRNFKK